MIVKEEILLAARIFVNLGTGAGKYLRLDSSAAEATTSTRWNMAADNPTVFDVGTASDAFTGGEFILICSQPCPA